MNERDISATSKLKNAMTMLIMGKYPEEMQDEGCSEDMSEVIKLFNIISNNMEETYCFATSLASGNLDVESPKKSNYMAAGLKELRSNLSHLTWQTQQVAKGDYKQRVDFMGDFSNAFNSMVEKLIERENKLKEDIEEQKRMEKELEYYAFTDQMTGVSNRRTGLLILEEEINKSRRNKTVLSICFLDIDGLKMVNDVYGHNEGDYLIVTISGIIKALIRGVDTLSRMGGDEFLIILHDCNSNGVQNVIDLVFLKMKEYNDSGEKPYKMDFSYGIEEIVGERITTIDDFIEKADKKMYRNKMSKKEKRIIE